MKIAVLGGLGIQGRAVVADLSRSPGVEEVLCADVAPVKVRGLGRAEALALGRELLAKVGLGDKAASYPAQLSGGQ